MTTKYYAWVHNDIIWGIGCSPRAAHRNAAKWANVPIEEMEGDDEEMTLAAYKWMDVNGWDWFHPLDRRRVINGYKWYRHREKRGVS